MRTREIAQHLRAQSYDDRAEEQRSVLLCAVVKVRDASKKEAGGLKWTRTTDLSLIRRVL